MKEEEDEDEDEENEEDEEAAQKKPRPRKSGASSRERLSILEEELPSYLVMEDMNQENLLYLFGTDQLVKKEITAIMAESGTPEDVKKERIRAKIREAADRRKEADRIKREEKKRLDAEKLKLKKEAQDSKDGAKR